MLNSTSTSTPSVTSTQTQRNSMLDSIMLASYTPGQIAFINFLKSRRDSFNVYDDCVVNRAELVAAIKGSAYVAVPAWIAVAPNRRSGRGCYMIPELNCDVATLNVNNNLRGRKPGSPNVKGRGIISPPPSAPTVNFARMTTTR